MANNTVKTIGALAVGAGIGAAVALLLAPQTGKQTRRKLRNSANIALNKLEDLQDDLRSRLTEWADEASGIIASGIACGKTAATEGGDNVKQVLERVKVLMDDGKERVERYVRSVAG
jgi:gas vesicle protein